MADQIQILYEDKWLVICRKPAGVSSESGGMPELLSAQLGGKFYCVHRLDTGVSGTMVYARNGKSADSLTKLFSSNSVEKEYLAVIAGIPEESSGRFTDLLFHDKAKNKTFIAKKPRAGVKEAVLDYRCLETGTWEGTPVSLVNVTLHSGRSHQIRVQFASRKMPLLGDGKYGSRIKLPSPALFSCRLAFPHPFTGNQIDVRLFPEDLPWTIFQLKEDI